jgi:hypothetical protein
MFWVKQGPECDTWARWMEDGFYFSKMNVEYYVCCSRLFQEHALYFNLYSNLKFKHYRTATCYNGSRCIHNEWRIKKLVSDAGSSAYHPVRSWGWVPYTQRWSVSSSVTEHAIGANLAKSFCFCYIVCRCSTWLLYLFYLNKCWVNCISIRPYVRPRVSSKKITYRFILNLVLESLQ